MENALHRPCVGGSSDWPATPMEQKRNVLLSTDLASVGAATFKLILLENNPIDSFVSCPLPLTQGQWRACLSAIKPGGSFSLPPTRGRHWQATFSGILPGFKTFWVLFPVGVATLNHRLLAAVPPGQTDSSGQADQQKSLPAKSYRPPVIGPWPRLLLPGASLAGYCHSSPDGFELPYSHG